MSIVLAFEHYGKFSFSRWGASSMAAQVRWHLRQFSGKQLWQKDNTMACLKIRVILLCTRSHIQWLKHRPKANKERLLLGLPINRLLSMRSIIGALAFWVYHSLYFQPIFCTLIKVEMSNSPWVWWIAVTPDPKVNFSHCSLSHQHRQCVLEQ